MAGAGGEDQLAQHIGHVMQRIGRQGFIRGAAVLQHTAGGLARSQRHSQGQPLIPAGRASKCD